jgi:hypothetical protein
MKERFGYLRGALGFIWVASRRWTIAWLLPLAIQGVLPIYRNQWYLTPELESLNRD